MLKEAGETYKDPSVHYKEKVCSSTVPATHEATLKPRNSRQVKNAQAQARKGRRYTQDDLFNLVELTYDIQDYTHRMFLVPELGVVLGHRAMLQEFRAVLCTKGQQPQLVSYDTTYNLSDFYVSQLLFRHTLFEGTPVIPVAFLIHEKRTQFAHEVFMDFIAKEIPEIAEAPFVTDREENIITAITKRLPQVRQLRCWNHLQSGARHWLRKHGTSSSECSVYVQDLKQLLMSPTERTTGSCMACSARNGARHLKSTVQCTASHTQLNVTFALSGLVQPHSDACVQSVLPRSCIYVSPGLL